MGLNILVILLAALIPTAVGFLWYNVLFAKAWMGASGMTEEKIRTGNMPVIFIVSILLSFMLAFVLSTMVIHQMHIDSLFMGDVDFLAQMEAGEGAIFDEYTAMKGRFDGYFRTFKHGMFHGTIIGIFVALPLLGINAMFERKGFKYIAINAGYWILTLMLMGGVICQWA